MNAISFIKDFLTNRIQHVCIKGTKSDWLKVKQGVPQGTIPRPFSFLLYVKDMTKKCYLSTEIIQHADDTLIFVADKNPSTASEAIERK